MDYTQFVKKLSLPDNFTAPRELSYEHLVATAITRDDLTDDVRGINASIRLIQQTRGGSWPTEAVSEEFNFVDLVWHELEFREGTSFTYVVRDTERAYLGCCYFYPMGGRTPLSPDLLGHDVDVSWWVTPHSYERGDYRTLSLAARHWITERFPFEAPYYSNLEIPRSTTSP